MFGFSYIQHIRLLSLKGLKLVCFKKALRLSLIAFLNIIETLIFLPTAYPLPFINRFEPSIRFPFFSFSLDTIISPTMNYIEWSLQMTLTDVQKTNLLGELLLLLILYLLIPCDIPIIIFDVRFWSLYINTWQHIRLNNVNSCIVRRRNALHCVVRVNLILIRGRGLVWRSMGVLDSWMGQECRQLLG